MPEYYITTREKDSIRFYQGDVRRRNENGHFLDTEKCEGFRGIHSAYRTLNCLMFPGVKNEMERIREKTGRLESQILREAEKALEVYCDIYRAMCKFALSQEEGKLRKVYRTERAVSIEELKKGSLVSFTSTSLESRPEDFLMKKEGLTFLEIIMSSSLPHLDFQEVLGEEYLFSQQKEILLPPFLNIEMWEMELNTEELQSFENIPQALRKKYLLFVKEELNLSAKAEDVRQKRENYICKEQNQKAAGILDKMIQHITLTEDEIDYYCRWKEAFRCTVAQEFVQINKEYFGKAELEDFRKDKLIQDVSGVLVVFNEKRKEYKKKLIRCSWLLTIFSVLPIISTALSFVNGFEVEMRLLAILSGAGLVFLTRFVRIEAYGIKLAQRTKTYLALCDLYREMRYETTWSSEHIDTFVQQFRDIMKRDTEMSIQNLQAQLDNSEALFQDEIDT